MKYSLTSIIVTFALASLFFVTGPSLSPNRAYAVPSILYADKDNTCPGVGSAADPYCTISRAFAAVSAGDTIRIRDSATPYDEQAKVSSNAKSGTASNPIIVEPDIGHNPIIRYTGNGTYGAAIWLENVDYWTIRNLTFDGTGIQTSRFALTVQATTRDVTGNSIIGNTFRNWGGTESNTSDNATVNIDNQQGSHDSPQQFSAKNTLIKSNTFVGNRGAAISLLRTRDTRIENNDISGQKCSSRSWSATAFDAVGVHIGGRFPMPANPDLRAYVANNTIHDFDAPENCGLGRPNMMGIWADVDVDNGIAEYNRIYNIGRDDDLKNGFNAQGIGIIIELQCDNWIVRNNTIYNTGSDGIRNGNDLSGTDPADNGDAINNQYLNNTIYRGGVQGINIRNGANVTVKNNIVFGSSVLQINVRALAIADGGHTINYNLYWNAPNGAKVGRWSDFNDRNFASWKSVCGGCDMNSLNKDPLFVNTALGAENFALQTGSPAIGAGEGGVTMGASQTGTPTPPTPTPTPTFCIQIAKPVCGVDGKTYQNSCVAIEQNKVQIAYDGPCRDVHTPTPTPTPSPLSGATISRNLWFGLKHAEVELLQRMLQASGYFPKSTQPTRYFGPATKKAVQAFQRTHGIPATGYVGPLTRQALLR